MPATGRCAHAVRADAGIVDQHVDLAPRGIAVSLMCPGLTRNNAWDSAARAVGDKIYGGAYWGMLVVHAENKVI